MYTKANFHVVSAITLNVILMVASFLTDNPLIIISILLYTILCGWAYNRLRSMTRGLIYLLPILLITAAINIIFVNAGSHVLFKIFYKSFTLEAFIYAIILCLKLVTVVWIFKALELMVDSDRALCFFSSKIPKVTLTMVIALKLIPNMKQRMATLRDIYAIRGIEYENGTIREKIKHTLPMLSVLLDSSLEGAFDIGEATYVRGFLSGKRTNYSKDNFDKKDVGLFSLALIILIVFSYGLISGALKFDVYSNLGFYFINNTSIIVTLLVGVITLFIILINKRGKKYGAD